MAEADRRTQEATGINEGLRRLKGDLPWRMDPKWQMGLQWVRDKAHRARRLVKEETRDALGGLLMYGNIPRICSYCLKARL